MDIDNIYIQHNMEVLKITLCDVMLRVFQQCTCGQQWLDHMARPNTVTIQYMVLFSHRIVQLPI